MISMRVLLHREIDKEAEAVVVRPQRLLTLALLILALKDMGLREPLLHNVGDFRPTIIDQVLNDRHVCVQSFEVCFVFPGSRVNSS
jgi:hypothetical protein